MLGRASWTFLHSTASYLPATLDIHEKSAFIELMNDIKLIYACSECRAHFDKIFADPVVQTELYGIATREDAQLWLWKIHNAVTSNNFPSWAMFPESAKLHAKEFLIPESSATQLRIANLTPAVRKEILAALNKRWHMSAGLDKTTRANDACPSSGYETVRVDFFAMAQCPFCREGLRVIKPLIKCDLTCVLGDKTLQGTLDFRIHFVGSVEGKKLVSLHGPNELEGDKIITCARQHYPMQYRWVDFMECMEVDQSKIPADASACAAKYNMNFTLLEDCAKEDGFANVKRDFEYGIDNKVDATPTVFVSHGATKHKVENPGSVGDVQHMLCQVLAAANGQYPAIEANITKAAHAADKKSVKKSVKELHPPAKAKSAPKTAPKGNAPSAPKAAPKAVTKKTAKAPAAAPKGKKLQTTAAALLQVAGASTQFHSFWTGFGSACVMMGCCIAAAIGFRSLQRRRAILSPL
eukprot:JP446093.1.p1 GENE.JP446093.1~~JP446093.1.p1  ORF type:complete len:519 (-),score=169.88 JP446093.1:137-1537(-)